jgi:pyrophosphatase PpaX
MQETTMTNDQTNPASPAETNVRPDRGTDPRARRRYEAVFFDLDGTLANTFPTVVRIFNQVLEKRTGRSWTLEELIPYFGPPETVILQRLFPEGDDAARMIEEFYQLCREDGAEIRPFEGIEPLVRRLRASQVRLGVYSGASTEAARIRVDQAGLIDCFEEILGGDRVERHKPDPEGLLHLLELFQVAPEGAVYVGDMVADVLAGQRAGMATVAVSWGAGTRDDLARLRPDYLVDHPAELEAILHGTLSSPMETL